MTIKTRELFDELKNIRTIELINATKNVVAKLLWATLGITGIFWAFYFVPNNYDVWQNNPSIISRASMSLSKIEYPAISIATPGSTKYAIAERLANYIKPNSLPGKLKEIRNLLLKCSAFQKRSNPSDKVYFNSYQDKCLFNFYATPNEKSACHVSLFIRTYVCSR